MPVKSLALEVKVSVKTFESDIFDYSKEWENTFDYVIEQTCFCAINPSRRMNL